MTIKDILFPTLQQDAEASVQSFSDCVHDKFKLFVQLFEHEVVLGNYQRSGSRSRSNKIDIKEKDFVLIRYPSRPGTYRYGRVIKIVSAHCAKILILRRKSEGTGKCEPQVMDTQNIILLKRHSWTDSFYSLKLKIGGDVRVTSNTNDIYNFKLSKCSLNSFMMILFIWFVICAYFYM